MKTRIKKILTAILALTMALVMLAATASASAPAAAAPPFLTAAATAPPADAPAGKPVITMNPADRTVIAGGTTTFSVAAAGAPILVYAWYERDDSGGYQQIEDHGAGSLYSGANTSRLTLSNVPASYNGRRYICRVSNSEGFADSTSATLSVTATGAPVITSQPVDSRVYEGGNATFSVIATGDPTPTYQWMYLDQLNESEWLSITDGGVFSGANTPILSLTNVPITYNGRRFMCMVSGSGVSVDSNTVRLSIVPPGAPIITSQPVSRSITEGKNATFTVTATGSPALSYQWMYRDLNNNTEWFNISNGGFYTGATTAALTITAATCDLDGYRFCCYLRNNVGNLQSAEVTLTVLSAVTAAPVIVGPESLVLEEGYVTTSSEMFTVTGGPGTVVKITAGDAKISWNDMTHKINIAEGLLPGVYPVTLSVSGATGADVLFMFELTILPKDVSGMQNFITVNTYEPGQFSDVDETAWYGADNQKIIVTAYEFGLMVGGADMTFNPNGNVTIAEAITVAARVHSVYMTGRDEFQQGDPWYQVYVDYAILNGIIADDDFADYTHAATRAEMAYIFAAALPEKELEAHNDVESLPDVFDDTLYCEFIFTLYRAGVLTGGDDSGTFKPYASITRAEAAAIISRIILPEMRVSGRTYSRTSPDAGAEQGDSQSGEALTDPEAGGTPEGTDPEVGGTDPETGDPYAREPQG